jgi:hypothetical protein
MNSIGMKNFMKVKHSMMHPHVLTLLCRDHPKMGNSMTCQNFAHRIAQKWVILVPFGNLYWHQNHHRWAGSFSLNHPKMGNSMKMLPMAHNPFKEFWFWAIL